jgi:hypothetical protein
MNGLPDVSHPCWPLNPMFVNYFWQQCVIGVRDALGHLAGLIVYHVSRRYFDNSRCTARFIGIRRISRLADLPDIEYIFCWTQKKSTKTNIYSTQLGWILMYIGKHRFLPLMSSFHQKSTPPKPWPFPSSVQRWRWPKGTNLRVATIGAIGVKCIK